MTSAAAVSLADPTYVATNEAMRYTVAQMIDHYVEETLPFKPRNRDSKYIIVCLMWWNV